MVYQLVLAGYRLLYTIHTRSPWEIAKVDTSKSKEKKGELPSMEEGYLFLYVI